MSESSTSFILLSSSLVFLMTPGIGILYSGFSNSKNALHIFMLCMLSYVVVTIQWVIFGFSLAFSETGSSIIGNLNYIGMKDIGLNIMTLTAPQIPSIVFALYQLQFATVTVAIIFGGTIERVKIFRHYFLYLFGLHWYMIQLHIGRGVLVDGLRICLV